MKSLREMLRYGCPEESEGDPVDQSEDPNQHARRWPISRRYMEAALQDICEYNDITEEQLVSAPETITSIEMFLYNFPHICCMSFFPNLVSLSLVQQNLLSIEGLHHCPHLELLRLSDNCIQRIEGLGNCLKLKELFLHSNRITHISNLSHLTALEVLWLSNNEIQWAEGLDNLSLKELSLAHNPISQLGEILNMKAIEFLNVAATNIGSFKEIGNLTRLKNLKDLRFSDPQWGDSPLALLHNYRTYILFRLRQLQSLDTVDLTDECKQAAKAMYTRKRVYYNMCIKSLQQTRNSSVTSSSKADMRRIKALQKALAKLMKNQKDLEKEMGEAVAAVLEINTPGRGGAVGSQKTDEWWVQIKSRLSVTEQQVLHLTKCLDCLQADMQLSKAKEQAAVDLNIHWLMVELDTGGNVRMEVGNSKEVWFKSCVDLVVSRFFATDFGRLSITGIQVLKVTRIHNRFLQDRFERILDAQMQKGSKMHVEYLLYGEMLQAPDELQWIIEEGFPFAPEHVPNGSQGPVLLSNSVGLADMCRLQAIAEHLQEASWRGKATGWLLVVKTCLGSSVRDLNCTFTNNPCVPFIKNGEMHPNTDGEKTVPAKKSLYPNADSVYRSHPLDPLQRSWSVFDSSLVVPEYLVEFEYVFKMEDPCEVDPVAASHPLQKVATKLPKVPGLVNGIEESSLGSERGTSSSGCQLPVAAAKVVHPGADVLDALAAAGPAASQATGPFVRLLSTNYLQKRNGLQDFSHVSYLNLHNSNLTGMEVLQGITGLKILILSFNKICKITGLDDLCVLEQLDLSYNALSRIEGLSGLNNLLTLDLAGNEIWCRDDIGLLQLQVPGLLNLNLRSNPLVEELGYQSLVLRALPLITQLDCNPITPEDHISAIQKFSTSPATLFSSTHLSNCKSQPPSASAVSLLFDERDLDIAAGSLSPKLSDEIPEGKVAAGKVPGLSGKEKVAAVKTAAAAVGLLKQMADPFRLSPYRLNQFTKFHRIDMASKRRLVHSSKNEPVLYEGIEEVHLEWRKLRTMYCFDSLPNLRRLFLSGNEILTIDGLENATMLEELILEDNLIKQVTGLENLHTLWRLDLGCNQLTSCLDMSSLVSIEQLSIDGNQIPSLKGLEGLLCLMELYAQNNLLLDMAEINYIGNLPKLMVVNLSGNALCGTHDYRLYTIYTLRKLKVLDGTNVDSTELTEARNKYKGRLTRDMLKDCIGQKEFSVVKALDLSDQRIRHCGDVFESRDLMGLTELNLNDNMISSIQTLRFLTNLVTLRLDNNSFENGSLLTTSLAISVTHATLTSMAEEERQGDTIDSVPSTSERGLESLEVLQMGGNSISSIVSLQLSFASKLKNLSLHNNKIIRVDGLEGLRNLEQLYLNHNSIKELEPSSFSGLQKLQILNMGDNALKTLVHFGSLLALVSLDMTSNLLTPSRLGGLSSIDNLSPLPNLAKLWLTNNPISRQNNYRIAVISRLKHLQQLDGRDVTEEERQEAEAYLMGGKEPTTLMMDPNVLLDSLPNSLMLGGQTKVPLKVTSLNFDNLCAAQTSTTMYTTIVANAGGLRGLNGFFSHANQVSGNSGYNNNNNNNNTGQKQLGEQFVDGNKQMAPPLQRKGNRGENKVLLVPIQNFLKNISPAKDGIMHTTMCELPCPKKSSLCLS